MHLKLADVLKFLASGLLGAFLFWFLYQDQDVETLVATFAEADPWWLAASVGVGLLSHYTRAYRWTLALLPLGHRASSFRAFLGVMVGYVVNLALPRFGEFVRCGMLKKTDDVPVNQSFGALITERAVDLMLMLVLAAFTLLLEFERIGNFLFGTLTNSASLLIEKLFLLAGIAVLGVSMLFVLYKLRSRFRQHFLYRKAKAFLLGLKDGLLSIGQLSHANRWRFVLLSLAIWFMYYLMSYTIFLSMPETAGLGLRAALTVLVMASIGMAVPTPGGTGSYHFFVAFSLGLYGLGEGFSKNFAFLMHGLQTMALIFFGALCLVTIVAFFKKPQNAAKQQQT